MLFYHRGKAVQTSAAKRGRLFMSRVLILEEDGEATSLGDLGYFANRQSALAFAMRCAAAFADGEPMPKPPCEIVHVTGAAQMSLSEDAENTAPDERAVSLRRADRRVHALRGPFAASRHHARNWSLGKAGRRSYCLARCRQILVVLLTILSFNVAMFDHCLYFNSSALARLAEREWGTVYAQFGLTPAQGFVLRVVLASPGCLSSQIADTLSIARPTATRLIDMLCQKKLVERRQAESDGREWCVYPSRVGKALERPINDASADIARTLRAKIGPELFELAVSSMHGARKALS